MKEKKGGVSLILFHCINNEESITHFLSEFDIDLHDSLENTYAVCIANNDDASKKKIMGGFIFKTSYTHNDQPEFTNACNAIAQQKVELSKLINEKSTFLPAVVKFPSASMNKSPLTEMEMLQIMFQQFVKHGVGGNV